MKSLLGLGSGGAISAIWEKIPAYVKIPVVFGLGILAASELTIDANHALQSARIFLGQAAQSEAQAALYCSGSPREQTSRDQPRQTVCHCST